MLDISSREYSRLSDYVLQNFGIKLGENKKSLVVGRLQHVLMQNSFTSFSEYMDYVLADKTGTATAALMNQITTNHTYFMREPDHFIYLKDHILPELMRTVKGKDLRIWSAGCSTGEEPYTLAMILRDYFADTKSPWDTRVLATDISDRALAIAKKGEYRQADVDNLPYHWGAKYFSQAEAGTSIVSDIIKNEVIYRLFNLNNQSFPFRRKFHIIFCRNVMIYFDVEAKRKLIARFYDCMEDGGYLFIGHSESLGAEKKPFKHIIPAVYRKDR